jgi:hypothetical protein
MGATMANTGTGRHTGGLVLAVAATLLIATDAAGAKALKVSWYADTRDPSSRNEPLRLGDGTRTLKLAAGWTCVVWPVQKTSAFEGRTTSCRKGTEIFEFSVQCDAGRPKDHAQIRFRNDAGIIDFIEVGCRPTTNPSKTKRRNGVAR